MTRYDVRPLRPANAGARSGAASANKAWAQLPDTVHCLSNNELRVALLLDGVGAVLEVREQFPTGGAT